ncbi:MAG: hypothetical protein SFX73_04660, partial [Kofleriaceae bacterium]|nr:hypothetical protein [Kofleriaceae bacterium]
MAVIIYGTRDYGRVDGAGGEYATTRFLHAYFLPLFPTRSTWITGQGPDGPRGHATTLYGKSVAAGYLRVWGPIVGFACLGAGVANANILCLVGALAALALTAWSWSWRSVRTSREQRRSDYNFVAYGTRCEPRRMPRELRADLKRMLDARWDARQPDRSPNDVAQHGARDAEEAAIAYGLLRLAALRRDGATDDRDADRILDDERVPLGANDGPYRATAEAPTSMRHRTLAALVELGLAARAQREPVYTPTVEQRAAQTKRTVRRARFGVAVATIFGLVGLPLFFSSVQPVLDADIKML